MSLLRTLSRVALVVLGCGYAEELCDITDDASTCEAINSTSLLQVSGQAQQIRILDHAGKSRGTLPELCTSQNKGGCNCMNLQGYPEGYATYTWNVNGRIRCLQTYTPPSVKKPMPVLLELQCYNNDRALNRRTNVDAERFGLARFQLSTPDRAWNFKESMEPTFINNDETPMRCSAEQNPEDIPYVAGVLDFIASRDGVYDAQKVYTSGFSQNGMFAGYIGFCFSHRVAGSWQGGAGLFIKGERARPPGKEGTCADCKYFPLYPCQTPNGKPHVTCLGSYLDDRVVMNDQTELTEAAFESGGHPVSMYKAHVDEGHDARMMLFKPTSSNKGHRDPNNKMDWSVGCLGITEPCSARCEAELTSCVTTVGGTAYANCLSELTGKGSCEKGCAPTKAMLDKSDSSFTWLSNDAFGPPADQTAVVARNSKCSAQCSDDSTVNCYPGLAVPTTRTPGTSTLSSEPSTSPAPSPGPSSASTSTQPEPPKTTSTQVSGACSKDCEDEFKRCFAFWSSQKMDAQTKCRSEIDSGVGRLGGVCTAGCVFQNTPTTSGASGSNSCSSKCVRAFETCKTWKGGDACRTQIDNSKGWLGRVCKKGCVM
eukprot:TRINITY_DN342_c0_g1_i3.p1 TRINITY_DN342_c0_g1~~TRINITY_DN342_c0_g1_i3.p1  ORF type:complete len:597 (+),score=70.92 TRINITY_DN342_c0_g1_i3:79-1869(+)